ncbi:MAG: TetR/AcrR family transcriptional regulator [Microthrixaceae bacterium]
MAPVSRADDPPGPTPSTDAAPGATAAGPPWSTPSSLIEERGEQPAVEDIAARSGVSVSSIFRYFDGLDDLREHAIQRYFERFAPRFEIPGLAEGPLPARIAALVDARLGLYEAIAPIAHIARLRALETPASPPRWRPPGRTRPLRFAPTSPRSCAAARRHGPTTWSPWSTRSRRSNPGSCNATPTAVPEARFGGRGRKGSPHCWPPEPSR